MSGESKWGWVKRILGLGPNWVRLVTARIIADDDCRYHISLMRHHSQVRQFEFVRLFLYYYARVLFLFHPENEKMIQSAQDLKGMVKTIFSRRVDSEVNALQRAGIDGEMALVTSEPQENRREITATLYYLSMSLLRGKLYLKADIPKDASIQHVIFSVPALLQSILPELDGRSVNVLNYAVGQMHEAYEKGRSFSELRNASVVPQEAFEAAARQFGQPPTTPDSPNP